MKKNMNRVTGICLGVIDMKKSLQFYRDKLCLLYTSDAADE